MSETSLRCPHCGQFFPLTEALAAQLRGEVEAALQSQHQAQLRGTIGQSLQPIAALELDAAVLPAPEAAEKGNGL